MTVNHTPTGDSHTGDPAPGGMLPTGVVTGVMARAHVDNIDAALPLYQRLTGAEPRRFSYRTMDLAVVGQFLLVSGADEEIRAHSGTIVVNDMDTVVAAIEATGGTLLEGPNPGPSGQRLVARHSDGNIYEYIERR